MKYTKKEILEALNSMYYQYCEGGHMFMGAGENASEILEDYGYIEVDGAGRITKNTYLDKKYPPKENKDGE